MRRPFLVPLALVVLAGAARSQDGPPPPAAPAPARPRRPAPPPIEGIVWERDFAAGMRRAVQEGRPVYLCVNALLDDDERGNVTLFQQYYAAKAVGDATRDFVCFVGNGNTHPDKTLPDGTTVCSRYGSGTCQAHKDALAYAVRRFSADGRSLVSPFHAVLDPDGAVAYRAEYMQGALEPSALDGYLVRLAPQQAMRAAWRVREDRMTALSKGTPDEVEKAGAAWIASGDAFAVAGLAAVLDQETAPARRRALMAALRGAGALGVPVLRDAVETATSAPDADPDAALAWLDLALAVHPDLGAYAGARLVARAKDAGLARRAAERWVGTGGPGAAQPPPAVRARLAEALALRGDASGAAALPADAEAGGLAPARVERAMRRAGKGAPPVLDGGSRDARRAALMAASPAQVAAARDAVRAALTDPVEEIRVAAALALRRAGDPSGAGILFAAIPDPVEGPEVRATLAELAGGDRGADPAAWKDVVLCSGGGDK